MDSTNIKQQVHTESGLTTNQSTPQLVLDGIQQNNLINEATSAEFYKKTCDDTKYIKELEEQLKTLANEYEKKKSRIYKYANEYYEKYRTQKKVSEHQEMIISNLEKELYFHKNFYKKNRYFHTSKIRQLKYSMKHTKE